ncbi:TlpA family protein disulfide reductase [Paenibacillus sp. IHBB 10380]|uniref:TlpA family protein disulfide reductase n=1 Tax=Paenibacillus sp. IHBB 10380 TaxID=1566358 RepID=UPI0005CF9FC3|nr:TlpA disulfide reductase family protein [Paenibacillus sp. IHBB 10380]AJS59422.1 redoxin [Paenibacillus sp. IHBB 10380]
MKRNLYIWLGALILVGIALYPFSGTGGVQAVFQQSQALPTETGPEAGKLAPPFSLVGLDEKMYQVGGEQDKAILLNFWASWCEPCKEEAPDLKILADQYKDDLSVYGVNVTKYDNKKNANKFVDKYQLNFPVMLDLKGTVYEQYKGMVFPTNVLINKHGVIQEVILGTVSAKELEKKVKQLIKS